MDELPGPGLLGSAVHMKNPDIKYDLEKYLEQRKKQDAEKKPRRRSMKKPLEGKRPHRNRTQGNTVVALKPLSATDGGPCEHE